MADKKTSIIAVMEILRKYSDEEHILTIRDILQKLETIYGLKLERRTIYNNIDMLEDMGMEISRYEQNGKGYYLMTRQFEPAEVLYLCNAIHASNFIPYRQSKDLISKLLDTQSSYQAKEFNDTVYMPNPRKTQNQELFLNIELISEAIKESKAIRFDYMKYTAEKNLVKRRPNAYTVEPRYIVYADTRAYMIATSDHHQGYGHYRIERMKNVHIAEQSVRNLPKASDPYEYARSKLFMFAGQNISAVLRCHISILDQMIDLFGLELSTSPQDDDHVVIRIQANRDGILFLGQQYMDAMEILEPQDLREEMIKRMEDRLKAYKMLEK